ncbi:hypothetical protein GQ44DRAFT_732914 [Phaeosphaeriaceae sp. PMI808]|nr:hypothetical protein GQ44DRAFT_732914 [Phaeosphaeriaceae sp. PMI808]
MCRKIFYALPTAPMPIDRDNENSDTINIFTNSQSAIWRELADEETDDGISDGSYHNWFEENRVLRTLESLEQNGRMQHQSFMHMEQLNILTEEEEEPTIAERFTTVAGKRTSR